MNYHVKPSAADIRQAIARAEQRVAKPVGAAYSEADHAARAERASLKDERLSEDDTGAHPLSIRSREKYLKGCAPIGGSHQGVSFTSTGDSKTLAPVGDEPQQDSACSLHSPTAGEIEQVGGADDEADESTYDPDFYQIKVDLYDNDGEKKSTRYRAALHIRAHPTTADKDTVKLMADFYNRPRDINKRLKEMGLDDHDWYLRFKAVHEEWSVLACEWEIPPKVAILKELVRDGNRVDSDVLGFAGAIIAHERGEKHPMIQIWYGGWQRTLVLDNEFTRNKDSNLIHKGFLRDAERAHLDVEGKASKPKFKLRRF